MNDKQTATVLAALRYFQGLYFAGVNVQDTAPDHFADHEPLTSTEINELCMQLNTNENLVTSLVIDTDNGTSVYLFTSCELANDALASFVRDWWCHEMGETVMPINEEEAIKMYFDRTDEWATIDSLTPYSSLDEAGFTELQGAFPCVTT